MSDYPYSSRSKSSLQGGRTPLKVIQPPSSFIDRVNKIFENTKKPYEKQLESERYQSPYTASRNDKYSTTLNAFQLKTKRKRYSKEKLRLELASLRLSNLFTSKRRQVFQLIREKNTLKESTFMKSRSQDSDFRTIIEETFRKFMPQTASPSVLTKCEKCGHVGLNFYTSSTKENMSPRFMDKVRQLLPSSNIKKSLSDVSTMPISDFYPNTFSISPFQDGSRDSLSNFSPEFSGGSKVQVPKLNFGKISIKSRYSEEVLKGSPVVKVNSADVSEGVKKLNKIFMNRVHRGFDMIFLARAYLPDQSLTFEFTLEESKISNEPSTLTGTFGDHNRILEISEIKKRREDSLSLEVTENWSKCQTLKTACKILYTRLDKLFYRRKVRGFYSLVDLMY